MPVTLPQLLRRRPESKMHLFMYGFGGLVVVFAIALVFLQLKPSSASLAASAPAVPVGVESPAVPSLSAPEEPAPPADAEIGIIDVVPFG